MTKKGKVMARFSISVDRNYKHMKRPPFDEVVRSMWEQLDDLGHDLDNALLVAPRGASFRQCLLALNEVKRQQKSVGGS
jgi:hypothetical protein